MMYTEVDFLDRFAAAAADGFTAVEYLFPYAFDKAEIAKRLKTHGLTQALFNGPPGDWEKGERGMASLPGREAQFRAGVLEQALPYAQALGCKRVHLMAGVLAEGADRATHRAVYVANLAWAAKEAAKVGMQILIEPINMRDVPRYFLNHQADAHEIVREIGAPNLLVQMDLYHCQIVEGDVAMKIRKYLGDPKHRGHVGYFQIAGVPDRNEPDRGELFHPYLFDLLDELGWDGFVGCEYRPKAGTSAGLGWFQTYKPQQENLQRKD
jgi:hydroxypyruvate isomerase